MNKLTLPLVGALMACSEYDLTKIDPNNTNGTDQTDTGDFYDTANPDSGASDTGSPDTDSTDTGNPDTGEDIPSTPFKTAITACLQLDEAACQWNASEGAQDTACTADAIARKTALEAKILSSAQAFTGNPSLTMTDVENGAVPTTVDAYYALHQSNLQGTPAWAQYAYINIAFGHVANEFNATDFPFDSIPTDTLRCMASSYSRDIDLPYDAATWSNLQSSNTWKKADGTTPEESILNVIDFSVYGTGSQTMEINTSQLDQSDPNYNFTTTYYALDDSTQDIFSVAKTYTGITGEGVGRVAHEY